MNVELITPDIMPYIPKRWGYEIHHCNNDKYCGKTLFIAAGRHTSYHMHPVKDEVLLCVEGTLRVVYGSKTYVKDAYALYTGTALRIEPGTYHQLQAFPGTHVKLMEFSTQHRDEDSVVASYVRLCAESSVPQGELPEVPPDQRNRTWQT